MATATALPTNYDRQIRYGFFLYCTYNFGIIKLQIQMGKYTCQRIRCRQLYVRVIQNQNHV